jgi:hypothetical protein
LGSGGQISGGQNRRSNYFSGNQKLKYRINLLITAVLRTSKVEIDAFLDFQPPETFIS